MISIVIDPAGLLLSFVSVMALLVIISLVRLVQFRRQHQPITAPIIMLGLCLIAAIVVFH